MKSNGRISVRNLELLPSPDKLLKLSQSLAILDAILQPEWDQRYYSFNAHWDDALGHKMASMRDGSGDYYFILFTPSGAVIIGCAHESAMAGSSNATGSSPEGLFDGLPPEFAESVRREPAFSADEATFCLWNHNEKGWQVGAVEFPEHEDPDGSADLLAILEGSPEIYVSWAREYYERRLKRESVERIYRHEVLTEELVKSLNRRMTLAELNEDLHEIGYPVG